MGRRGRIKLAEREQGQGGPGRCRPVPLPDDEALAVETVRELVGQVPAMLRQLRDKGSVSFNNQWCDDPTSFGCPKEAVDHLRTHELEVRVKHVCFRARLFPL